MAPNTPHPTPGATVAPPGSAPPSAQPVATPHPTATPSLSPSATAPGASPSTEYNPDGSSKTHGLDQVPTAKQSADAKWPPIKGKGEVKIEESKLEVYAKALEADLKVLKVALDKVLQNGAAPGLNLGVKGDPADIFSQVLTDQHNAFTTYFTNLQKSYQDVANGLRTALKTSKQAGVDSTPTYTPPAYTPPAYTPTSYQ